MARRKNKSQREKVVFINAIQKRKSTPLTVGRKRKIRAFQEYVEQNVPSKKGTRRGHQWRLGSDRWKMELLAHMDDPQVEMCDIERWLVTHPWIKEMEREVTPTLVSDAQEQAPLQRDQGTQTESTYLKLPKFVDKGVQTELLFKSKITSNKTAKAKPGRYQKELKEATIMIRSFSQIKEMAHCVSPLQSIARALRRVIKREENPIKQEPMDTHDTNGGNSSVVKTDYDSESDSSESTFINVED